MYLTNRFNTIFFMAIILFPFFQSFAEEEKTIWHASTEYLEAVSLYHGDNHGDFKNNYVAILSDGSRWKIHPDDADKFSSWTINDECHIAVRTSFYFFKREHKFELFNHTRNESVRAMIVRYPPDPLKIIDMDIYVYETWYETICQTDEEGHVIYCYEEERRSYEAKIYLSDGTIWIARNFGSFDVGAFVYVGYNIKNGGIYCFMLTGAQREAVWAWAW